MIMRLRWDARKRRLIAVDVADEIFLLLQSPGNFLFVLLWDALELATLKVWLLCHVFILGGCGCLVPGIFSWTSSWLDPSLTPSIVLDFLHFFLGISILSCPTFSEITQAWQCLKIVFIWSDEFTYWISTSYYVLNLRYRPHYSKYKDLYYTPQNHWTMTTWNFAY